MADTYLTDITHIRDFEATPSGDLGRISGVPNLQNALYHCLITTPSSLVHRPNYGVGVKNYQNTLNRLSRQRDLALKIQEQYELDPRVESVIGVLVEYDDLDPTKTKITVKVKPIGQGPQSMIFTPFGGA